MVVEKLHNCARIIVTLRSPQKINHLTVHIYFKSLFLYV